MHKKQQDSTSTIQQQGYSRRSNFSGAHATERKLIVPSEETTVIKCLVKEVNFDDSKASHPNKSSSIDSQNKKDVRLARRFAVSRTRVIKSKSRDPSKERMLRQSTKFQSIGDRSQDRRDQNGDLASRGASEEPPMLVVKNSIKVINHGNQNQGEAKD